MPAIGADPGTGKMPNDMGRLDTQFHGHLKTPLTTNKERIAWNAAHCGMNQSQLPDEEVYAAIDAKRLMPVGCH
jgi:hypothetical protein